LKVIAIIQARMGSTRLPKKVLMKIQAKPMLWHIINRLRYVNKIDDIVIATSDLDIDDAIYEFSKKYKVICFRGSESDVLKRFYDAAAFSKADHIIRITGDCPMVDSLLINDLIKLYQNGKYDFCGIACGAGVSKEKNIKRYPDGLDAEIFSFRVLKEAHFEAKKEIEREHVTPFIWQNTNRYLLGTLFSRSTDYSNLRLTVDNKQDFEFIDWIYKKLFLENNNFVLSDIIKLLKNNPNAIINKHLIGDEGYEEFWK